MNILDLTSHLPEFEFAEGDIVISEGGRGGTIWVLVSGAVQVLKGDVAVNTIAHPGAMIGEMSLLLGKDHSATVVAIEPTRLRCAVDGHELMSDPAITKLVAVGLAERLAFVTTYLADLRHQYGDAPGLAMVSSVLSELEQRKSPKAVPGSLRDPNPDY